ncbi:hypothetical protein [Microscilla marina]|uniref:Uncharacterized protein n=1 Tax=Microscilla marina ATCC 23134 TaxID=313606 RepID=A1ZN33_MICM2|nr:hypothetical protein [Microscilla marina]EAY28214.1 hypothetical protein M23134_03475 [Microscilla marina ATCC 23134]
MTNELNNKWTVLSNEEMNQVKGGMDGEDPTAFAQQNPDAFMDLWQNDPQKMAHWYQEAGYSRRQMVRHLRRFMRRYGRC